MLVGLPERASPQSEEEEPAEERPPLRWPRLRGSVGAVFAGLALLFLHVVIAAYFWIPDPGLATILRPTWDVGVLVLLLVGWAALGVEARWATRVLVIGLSAIVFLYFLLGLGQGLAMREFGYEVVLRLHLAYVPELFRMMYDAEPLGWFIFYVALIAAGTLAVVFAMVASVRHLHAFARAGRRRQVGLAAGAAASFGFAAALVGISGTVSTAAYRQVDLAINLEKRIDTSASWLEMDASGLRRANPFLRGAERPTILVFVIESYGRVLWSDPAFSQFPIWLNRRGAELGAAGYRAASKELVAPVFGGSSWLAGSSLLCGVRIDDQKRYEALFASSVQCLPALLKKAGYRTVISAANAKFLESSYARLFPFDAFYFRDTFGYRGPRLGWSFVPDQFTIEFVHQREMAARARPGPEGVPPLFVAYLLTTSHHPWATIPAFVPDWSSLGDGSIYGKLPVTRFHQNGFIKGSDYKPAYRTSIQYSWQSIAAYLERLPRDDRSLVFVLGDHQPRRPIGRMKADRWTVPIHVLSRDPDAVARFARVGYRPGFTPVAEGSPRGLESFIQELFVAYRDGG